MGVHSTMRITAGDARKVLLCRILKAEDQELKEMLNAALYDTLYNFSIVDDYVTVDEYGYPIQYDGKWLG